MAGLVLAIAGAPLRGQQVPPRLRDVEQPPPEPTSPSGHVLLISANMVVSGLTSGTLNWHHGGSFLDGFVKGAVGGAAIYGGKALAVQDGTAAPFFGRQLASVGASAVRNAGLGQGMFSDVSLPFGPLRLHLAPGTPQPARLALDVLGVASLAGALFLYDSRIDWRASLAAAAPVFVVADPDDNLPWNGRHVGGLLMVRDDRGSARPVWTAETLAHERVHLLEYDQLEQLWSAPFERALLGRWRFTRDLQPHISLGLNAALNAGFRLLPRALNPVEVEAEYLVRAR